MNVVLSRCLEDIVISADEFSDMLKMTPQRLIIDGSDVPMYRVLYGDIIGDVLGKIVSMAGPTIRSLFSKVAPVVLTKTAEHLIPKADETIFDKVRDKIAGVQKPTLPENLQKIVDEAVSSEMLEYQLYDD
ncbi:hypothetical protein CHS0354_018593 [Potamilus streckersoni]|uniref:Uncharacterized protein n=1 Tax=Potamilus streckersoni TaxID=2493646 RepID=A0AAE0WBD0_9BIVA|nr:hypothetical protein CHS0354_018593 [Potamilus streckersoni]